MTSADSSFEEYLVSKKIDSEAFRKAEPDVWNAWKNEFEQIHPNSFTLQKLNMINPVRRKYLLQAADDNKLAAPPSSAAPAQPPAKPAKPMMRPKPDRDSLD